MNRVVNCTLGTLLGLFSIGIIIFGITHWNTSEQQLIRCIKEIEKHNASIEKKIQLQERAVNAINRSKELDRVQEESKIKYEDIPKLEASQEVQNNDL